MEPGGRWRCGIDCVAWPGTRPWVTMSQKHKTGQQTSEVIHYQRGEEWENAQKRGYTRVEETSGVGREMEVQWL